MNQNSYFYVTKINENIICQMTAILFRSHRVNGITATLHRPCVAGLYVVRLLWVYVSFMGNRYVMRYLVKWDTPRGRCTFGGCGNVKSHEDFMALKRFPHYLPIVKEMHSGKFPWHSTNDAELWYFLSVNVNLHLKKHRYVCLYEKHDVRFEAWTKWPHFVDVFFKDDIVKKIFDFTYDISIPLKIVNMTSIDNELVLVQELHEKATSCYVKYRSSCSLAHICVAGPQCVDIFSVTFSRFYIYIGHLLFQSTCFNKPGTHFTKCWSAHNQNRVKHGNWYWKRVFRLYGEFVVSSQEKQTTYQSLFVEIR